MDERRAGPQVPNVEGVRGTQGCTRCASLALMIATVVAVALIVPGAASAAVPGWGVKALSFGARATDFVTPSHGWVVGSTITGDSGMGQLAVTYWVRETMDGGSTWSNRSVPDGLIPTALAFGDATHGWLLGVKYDAEYNQTGYIYGTSNAGATWTLQATGITDGYSDIDAADATHAYTFKSDVISGTSDGSTWTTRSTGLSSRYESLHVSRAGQVWLGGVTFSGGATSVIVVSKDGGTSFAKQTNPGKGKIWAVYGLDATHAWAAGYESATFLRTTDGGASWKPVTMPGKGDVFSIAFTSATHGWVATTSDPSGKTLFETNDGGATWTGYAPGTTGAYLNMRVFGAQIVGVGGSTNSSIWSWPGSGGGGGGTVLGKASLGLSAPKTAKRNVAFYATGSIRPAHTASTIAVKVACYLKIGAKYVLKKTATATAVKLSGSSRLFKAKLVLGKGTWKLVATHKDAGHASSASTARYVTVK